MSSEPEQRGGCRLTLTINVVHFSVRPIPSEKDQSRRALLSIIYCYSESLQQLVHQAHPTTQASLPTLPGFTPGPGLEPSLSASGRPPRARRTRSPRWNAPAPPCFAPGSAARSIFDGRLMASSLKGFWIITISLDPDPRPGEK